MWYNKLKAMKNESGLTTKDISMQSGIPEPTLEKLFAGVTKDPKLETMRQLVHCLGYTLDDLEGGPTTRSTKNAPPYSDEALKLAKDFDTLDKWGKQVVCSVISDEQERMADESRSRTESTPGPEPKVINLFLNPSAAGMALGITNADSEPYTLKESDPQGAAYAVRLQGDSMEPDFPDGSIVFVNHDQMRDGDIGIFCVDGATVCKQWHYAAGVTHLFSLNRKRADADVVIPMDSNRSLVWQGRVITKKRYRVPGV